MAYTPALAEYPSLFVCGHSQVGLILNRAVTGKYFETTPF